MSWLKRTVLMITATVLFITAALPSYAAPSPHRDDYITVITEDDYEVIIWRMPQYLDKLSEKAKKKYERYLPLEPGEVIYVGDVLGGKYKDNVVTMITEDVDTAYANADAAPQPDIVKSSHGIYLMASNAGIRVAEALSWIADTKLSGIKLADECTVGPAYSNNQADVVDTTIGSIRKDLTEAYAEIKETKGDLTKLEPKVADKAAEAGVELKDCRVTQVFDLSAFKGPEALEKDDMGTATVKVVGISFQNFVCILHRNNGNWELVDDAKATKDILKFTTKSFSPFAVVTWEDKGLGGAQKRSPKTGDNTLKWIGATVFGALLIACAAFVLIAADRKKRQ